MFQVTSRTGRTLDGPSPAGVSRAALWSLGYAHGVRDEAASPEDLFAGFPESLEIFRAVEEAVSGIGHATLSVTKSQVAFRRRRGFAYVWRPGQYVKSDVPAVLSIAMPHEVVSDRFKEVVHPSANVWMHHIELREVTDVDTEVVEWLAEAHRSAR